MELPDAPASSIAIAFQSKCSTTRASLLIRRNGSKFQSLMDFTAAPAWFPPFIMLRFSSVSFRWHFFLIGFIDGRVINDVPASRKIISLWRHRRVNLVPNPKKSILQKKNFIGQLFTVWWCRPAAPYSTPGNDHYKTIKAKRRAGANGLRSRFRSNIGFRALLLWLGKNVENYRKSRKSSSPYSGRYVKIQPSSPPRKWFEIQERYETLSQISKTKLWNKPQQ